MTTETSMPVTSPGIDSAGAGDSLTLPGLPANYMPDRTWVLMRLEDANRAFSQGCYEEMRDALGLADSMMRFLERHPREEPES